MGGRRLVAGQRALYRSPDDGSRGFRAGGALPASDVTIPGRAKPVDVNA